MNKKATKHSYTHTMATLADHLKPYEKLLSRIVHTGPIEKISSFIGATIAHPSAMLGGTICAFLGTLLAYTLAHYNGFTLSGAETIASFSLGWVLGLLGELALALRHK